MDLFKEPLIQFRVFNTNARKLILVNFIIGLFNPFYIIFANTFIFTSSKGNLSLNLIFSCCSFLGLVFGFILNGYFLRYIHVKRQLIAGILILFLAIVVMFLLPNGSVNINWVIFLGLFSGIGNGIYWSSRNYLTVVNTNNSNRDFFAGIDFILISVGRIITPLIVGIYIGEGIKLGWISHQFAYRSTLIIAFLLIVSATFILLPRKYKTAKPNKYFYFKYSKLWGNARKMFFVLGSFQGAVTALPPVIIMKFLGNESAVGLYTSICYFIAITTVYIISKKSSIQHRSKILKYTAIALISGAILFILLIHSNSYMATACLIVILFLTEPLFGFPARASFMKALDELKYIENRDTYTYVVDVEIFTGIGRISSLLIFFTLYIYLPIFIALSIYISYVSLLQLTNIRHSKKLNGY